MKNQIRIARLLIGLGMLLVVVAAFFFNPPFLAIFVFVGFMLVLFGGSALFLSFFVDVPPTKRTRDSA